MNEVERLKQWMDRNDHTLKSLARCVGMSYHGVQQVVNHRKRISPGFRLRFIQAFGAEVADSIFDTLEPSPSTPEPEPDPM